MNHTVATSGVAIQDLRPAQAQEMKLPVKTGALVTRGGRGQPGRRRRGSWRMM